MLDHPARKLPSPGTGHEKTSGGPFCGRGTACARGYAPAVTHFLRFTAALGRALLLVPLALSTGCAGELTAFAALTFSMSLGAWLVSRERHRRALEEAHGMRLAITSGSHRALELRLRQELALADAGEAVSEEREWLARAQLGGLLLAEWRLDEAREVYGGDEPQRSPALRGLAAYGRHELALVTQGADGARLAQIREDRDETLRHVPQLIRRDVERAWHALEGLCLVRMGRAREALPLLEGGLRSLEFSPARVVYLYHLGQAYEHVGERDMARKAYGEAQAAFPGTRLASEAKARVLALEPGAGGAVFRGMLPEAPEAAEEPAVGSGEEDGGEAPA